MWILPDMPCKWLWLQLCTSHCWKVKKHLTSGGWHRSEMTNVPTGASHRLIPASRPLSPGKMGVLSTVPFLDVVRGYTLLTYSLHLPDEYPMTHAYTHRSTSCFLLLYSNSNWKVCGFESISLSLAFHIHSYSWVAVNLCLIAPKSKRDCCHNVELKWKCLVTRRSTTWLQGQGLGRR